MVYVGVALKVEAAWTFDSGSENVSVVYDHVAESSSEADTILVRTRCFGCLLHLHQSKPACIVVVHKVVLLDVHA